MKTVEQYREFARDCRRMAVTAKDAEKAALLEIAAAWESLATQREAQLNTAGINQNDTALRGPRMR